MNKCRILVRQHSEIGSNLLCVVLAVILRQKLLKPEVTKTELVEDTSVQIANLNSDLTLWKSKLNSSLKKRKPLKEQ